MNKRTTLKRSILSVLTAAGLAITGMMATAAPASAEIVGEYNSKQTCMKARSGYYIASGLSSLVKCDSVAKIADGELKEVWQLHVDAT